MVDIQPPPTPEACELLNQTSLKEAFNKCSDVPVELDFSGALFREKDIYLMKSLWSLTRFLSHRGTDRANYELFSVKIAPFFGGIFGITAWAEAVYKRFAIVGVAKKSYFAHGVLLDLFSAFCHDVSHMQVAQFLEQELISTNCGLAGHHFDQRGTDKGFRQAGVIASLGREQNRFLTMLNILNEEAFRRWGGTSDYAVYALAQFLLTHEFPTFDKDMMLNLDFIRTLKNTVKEHNNGLSNSNLPESHVDLLHTNPVTGKSDLSDPDIIQKLITKYIRDIEGKAPVTQEMQVKKNEIAACEERIAHIEGLQSVDSLEDRESATKTLAQEKGNLVTLKESLKKLVRSTFTTTLTNETGNFYELTVRFINSNNEPINYSEHTLRFKSKNYADTRGLLKIAGVTLPAMPKDVSREDARSHLKKAVKAWRGVMRQFVSQASWLAQNTINPGTGRSLAEDFFRFRLNSQERLKAVLRADRAPDRELEDYRPTEAKTTFKDW